MKNSQLKLIIKAILSVAVFVVCMPLSAHAYLDIKHNSPREMVEKRIEGIGSPFTRHLFRNYKIMVMDEEDNFNLSSKAQTHFYHKAAVASEGDVVMPEPLDNWRLNGEEPIVQSYYRLVDYLDTGAREIAPNIAARAQFYYDCWAMYHVGQARGKVAEVCKDRFYISMADLVQRTSLFKPNPQVRKMAKVVAELESVEEDVVEESQDEQRDLLDLLPPAPGEVPKVAVSDAKFLVFFDFDSSTVDETAGRVLNSVSEQIKGRDDLKAVITIGHTDTRGTDQYNKRLSFERAGAVRSALIELGVDADLLKIRAMGETRPMVQTSDNVKEPANRRVEITFE